MTNDDWIIIACILWGWVVGWAFVLAVVWFTDRRARKKR